MKTLLFVIFTSLIFVVGAFGQSACPIISVTGPSGLTPKGGYMSFLAKVEGIDLDKINYKWSISSGQIVDGQGTPVISITSTDMNQYSITVKVEITELPPTCPNTVYAVGEIIENWGLSLPVKVDEVSNKGLVIDKPRLQNLALTLNSESSRKAYLIERFRLKTSPTDIKKKLVNSFSFLTKTLGISEDRITWQISYGDENLTEFWFIPARADAPKISENGTEIRGEDFHNQIDKLFPKTNKKLSKTARKTN